MSAIIFLSILIIVLSLILIIDVSVFVDLIEMNVYVTISLYRIKLFKIEINLLTLKYKINNRKYKTLSLILKREEKYLISQIKSNILNKLYYDKVSLDVVINLISPDITANVIGILNNISQIFNFVLMSYNADMDIYFNYQPDFNKLTNKLNFNLKVYFTVFDMLYAIILSFYKRGKYVKEKR